MIYIPEICCTNVFKHVLAFARCIPNRWADEAYLAPQALRHPLCPICKCKSHPAASYQWLHISSSRLFPRPRCSSTTAAMAILTLLESLSPGTTLLSISLLSSFAFIIYRAYLHPLAPIPGPLHCRLTSLWSYYHSYLGDECTQITALHRLYGPVLRVGPNEVCVADGAALAPIYSEKGGFLKADNYRSFDFEGHATIFSAIEREHRAKRAKAVVGMFSMGAVRAGNGVIEGCVDRFVGRLKEEAEESRRAGREGGKVNVLNLTRSLALDAISAYLFGKRFGGVDERGEKMSASGYVDLVVALGRFFFLPTRVFRAIEKALEWVGPLDKEALESAEKVDGFVEGLIEREGDAEKGETYQGRLLKAGISRQETRIQCDDVIFAGTDSTGMNMSMLCWYLAKHPDVQVCTQPLLSDHNG